jgi:hypothetical protein
MKSDIKPKNSRFDRKQKSPSLVDENSSLPRKKENSNFKIDSHPVEFQENPNLISLNIKASSIQDYKPVETRPRIAKGIPSKRQHTPKASINSFEEPLDQSFPSSGKSNSSSYLLLQKDFF